MIESPSARRAILAVLVLVVVACLGTVALIVLTRGAGDGLGDKLSSLRDDEAPPASATVRDREQALARAREFVTRFNTYNSDMLDEQGQLGEYRSVSDLMSAKFAGVFEENVEIAEQNVAQIDAASVGAVYAVGVASQDRDSAEVLVAGTVDVSYVYREKKGDEGTRIESGPKAVRYQVSLIRIDGQWLVDDLDDIDDGQPPLSQPNIPEEPSTDQSTTPPTTPPSDGATTGSTEGDQ